MKVPLRGRLLLVTLVHAVFSQFGDIMSACLNLMNVPIRKFFHESMQNHYGPLSDQQFETYFSACAAAMFVGLMLGFLSMGHLMDSVGRKQTVIIRCFLGVIGSMAMLLSHVLNSFELFVVGHMISGIVMGLKVVLIIYLAECSPDNKRGITALAVNSGGVILILIVTPLCLPTLIGTDELWFLLPCITALFAVIHLCFVIFFPQSPKQLYIQRHDKDGARRSLRFYYGDGHDKEIESAMLEMKHEKKQACQESFTIVGILQHDTHRFAFFLVLICALIPVFSAINIKSQYLVTMLISFGLSQTDATTAMMVISGASIPVGFVAPWLIERFGRRPMFVGIAMLCSLEWLGFAAAQALNDVQIETPATWMLAVGASILGQSAVNMGLLVMAPIMISEICPHNIRATVSQFTQVPPISIAVLEVFLFPTLRSHFGFPFFLFLSASCAALAFVLHVQMLETAGLAVDEIVYRMSTYRRMTHTGIGWTHYGSLWDSDPAIGFSQLENTSLLGSKGSSVSLLETNKNKALP